MNMSQPKMGYETLVSETFTSAQIKRIREQDAIDQRQKAQAREAAAKAAKRQVRI
jgi:hypothetical protein